MLSTPIRNQFPFLRESPHLLLMWSFSALLEVGPGGSWCSAGLGLPPPPQHGASPGDRFGGSGWHLREVKVSLGSKGRWWRGTVVGGRMARSLIPHGEQLLCLFLSGRNVRLQLALPAQS